MSAAPQRGRRRAEPVRRPSLFGPASAPAAPRAGSRAAFRTAGHAAAAPASPATKAVRATAKGMAAVAVVGALVAAGAIAQQIGAPSGPDSLASIVSAAEAPAAISEASSSEVAVSAPLDAAITFPGVKVSSSASATAAPVKAEAASVKPVDDPAAAQAYASGQLGSFGWGADQMSCLTQLWQRESEWLTSAENVSSGAYGIAQSLPASKMESTGSDWSTNYETQIRWGMGYIQGRYGSPCAAWGHSNAVGWY